MINLGTRLKLLRTNRGFTMRQLARKAGCSASFLSQLEMNRASPTLANLEKICRALDLSVVDALRDEPELGGPIPISMRADNPLAMRWHKVRMRHLLPEHAPRPFTALQMIMEVGGDMPARHSRRSMNQLAIVRKGQVELTTDNQTYTLGPDSAMYFDLARSHYWRNVGTETAEVLLVHPYAFRLFEQEEEDLIWSRRKAPAVAAD